MKKIRALLIFLNLTFAYSVLAQEEIRTKVDVSDATKLIQLAIVNTEYEKIGYGTPRRSVDGFFTYEFPCKFDGTCGWLAVNAWTGDIWDVDKCQLLSNPALQREQTEIKDKFNGHQLKIYNYYHSMQPERVSDLEPCSSPE